jgi:predicted O-methyltransferase YrrM
MFSPAAQAVLARYEARRAAETERMRTGNPAEMMGRRDELLLSVGPEAGEFLRNLAIARGATRILELGTSYGYSTLFLADAAKRCGGRLITMELAPEKQAYAQEMLEAADLADVGDWRLGDAVELIEAEQGTFDFVLLDIWKELYLPCLKAFYPKLAEEAVIAADNMIDPPMHRADARAYRAAIAACPDLQSALLPVGQGIELSVKWTNGNPKL